MNVQLFIFEHFFGQMDSCRRPLKTKVNRLKDFNRFESG